MSLYSHNGRPSLDQAAQNAALLLAREHERRRQLLEAAAQNSALGWGGSVLPGSLSSLPWASRPNLEKHRAESAHTERSLQATKAARAKTEPEDPEERARRRRAWEALTDKPDVESFLAAAKACRPEKARARPMPKLFGPSGLTMKISISTAERASVAGAGASPEPATACPAAEVQQQQVEERESEDSEEDEVEAEAEQGSRQQFAEEDERRAAKREEKRKREEWRKKWREERSRRAEEKRRRERREMQKSKSRMQADELEDTSDSSTPRERLRRRRANNKDDDAPGSKRGMEKFVSVMSQSSAAKAGPSFTGQISDAELDKLLKSREAATSSGEPLMSEEQVLAKMQKARARAVGR